MVVFAVVLRGRAISGAVSATVRVAEVVAAVAVTGVIISVEEQQRNRSLTYVVVRTYVMLCAAQWTWMFSEAHYNYA